MKGSETKTDEELSGQRVIVIGMGPAGRHVVHTLKQNNFQPVIIDVNPQSRRFAARENIEVHLGDAASEEILDHAGLDHACMVVVTVPDAKVSAQIIRTIRMAAPSLSIVARNRYNRYKQELDDAGATIIIDEETLMGQTISQRVVDCIADGSCTLMACRMTGKQMPAEEPADSSPV